MKERSGANILMVSLLAAGIGAGIALLTAPASGKETRQKLKQRGTKLRLQAKQQANRAKAVVDQNVQRGKAAKDSFVHAYKETQDNIRNEEV